MTGSAPWLESVPGSTPESGARSRKRLLKVQSMSGRSSVSTTRTRPWALPNGWPLQTTWSSSHEPPSAFDVVSSWMS